MASSMMLTDCSTSTTTSLIHLNRRNGIILLPRCVVGQFRLRTTTVLDRGCSLSVRCSSDPIPLSSESSCTAKIIDGKAVAKTIRDEIKLEVTRMKKSIGVVPAIALIHIGDIKDSDDISVRGKLKAFRSVGMEAWECCLPEIDSEEDVIEHISNWNNGHPHIHGVLVQLPLPRHMDKETILYAVGIEKDVEGYTSLAMRGREEPLFLPCTPKACIELLRRYNLEIKGKRAVVVIRSCNTLGMPTALLLEREDATVSIIDSRTKNPEEMTREADIIESILGLFLNHHYWNHKDTSAEQRRQDWRLGFSRISKAMAAPEKESPPSGLVSESEAKKVSAQGLESGGGSMENVSGHDDSSTQSLETTQSEGEAEKGKEADVVDSDAVLGMGKEAGSNARAWSDVVQKTSLKRYDLVEEEVDGKKGFRVPDEILSEMALWDDCIIGKFLAKAPHVGSIHMTVNRIWSTGNKDIKVDVYVVNDTMVKFRIKDAGVRARVLRRGMWNIKDVPMLVSKWNPLEEESQPEMKSIPLWVLVKNVPRNMYSWPGLSHLVSPIGEPRQLHPDTVWWKNPDVARVFVEVDLTKPLPESHCFHFRGGKSIEVQYEFPWLPPRCSSCSRWGHSGVECKVVKSPQKMLVRSTSGTSSLKNIQISPVKVVEVGDKSESVLANAGHATSSSGKVTSRSPSTNGKNSSSPRGKRITTNDDDWQSPAKTSRLRLSDEVLDTVQSSSRFSALDDDLEDKLDEDELDQVSSDEENDTVSDAIVQNKENGKQDHKDKSDTVIQQVDTSRASLHRVAKASHKFIPGPSSPKSLTKGRKSSGKKKRKNKKNH